MSWNRNDGGRADAGFRGSAGDCVTRAIAIAADLPYREVYDTLFEGIREFQTSRTAKAKRLRAQARGTSGTTPRNGVDKGVYGPYLATLGFVWTPTMSIGSGCTVHLRADELPSGRIVCRVSKHVVAVVDGIAQDTHDCTRDGTRCVYGYWSKRGDSND